MPDNFKVTPGALASSVILHVPHASRTIPDDVRARMVATDDQLTAELDTITDTGTDGIAADAARHARTRPWVLTNRLSRLVIDPERFPDEREELNRVGRGAVYTRLCTGEPLRGPGWTPEDDSMLMDRWYWPYAAAMTQLTRETMSAAGGVATILDVHSYPAEPGTYEVHRGPRPEVCIGTDPTHTPDWLTAAATRVFAEAGFTVDTNTPFSGCYIPLPYYGNPQVRGLMVEIRKDVYLTARGRSALLGYCLADLVNAAQEGEEGVSRL